VFPTYPEITEALREVDGLKVGTWWQTAEVVRRGSERRGVPVYLVQDMDAGYYVDPFMKSCVEVSYANGFHYLTNGFWVADQLRSRGLDCEIVKPGVDAAFTERPGNGRDVRTIFAFARGEPMKNFSATVAAWELLRDRDLLLAAVVGEQCPLPESRADAMVSCARGLSDAGIAELYNRASVYVLTSRHEGYGLTILEAWACGCPVVTTLCDGNGDFVRGGENCIIVSADDPTEIAAGVERVFAMSHGELDDMREAGRLMAATHNWTTTVDNLERLYREWSE